LTQGRQRQGACTRTDVQSTVHPYFIGQHWILGNSGGRRVSSLDTWKSSKYNAVHGLNPNHEDGNPQGLAMLGTPVQCPGDGSEMALIHRQLSELGHLFPGLELSSFLHPKNRSPRSLREYRKISNGYRRNDFGLLRTHLPSYPRVLRTVSRAGQPNLIHLIRMMSCRFRFHAHARDRVCCGPTFCYGTVITDLQLPGVDAGP
jgi:hypothetical protein